MRERQRRDTEANHEPVPPKPRTFLVRWHCPDCGIHQAGWIEQFDSRPRVCRGHARIDQKRVSLVEICGAIMNIVHDERTH